MFTHHATRPRERRSIGSVVPFRVAIAGMRESVPSLLLAMVLTAAACSPFRESARSPSRPVRLRRFYLTKMPFQGSHAVDACARGFHMASRFELLDVSALEYDTKLGFRRDDSGSGPPIQGTPGLPGASGWIRTGGPSQFSEPKDATDSAVANCAAWSSNSHDAFGTVAHLTDRFAVDSNCSAVVWNGGPQRCDLANPVWCVETNPASESEESHRRGRRHRLSEEPEPDE